MKTVIGTIVAVGILILAGIYNAKPLWKCGDNVCIFGISYFK